MPTHTRLRATLALAALGGYLVLTGAADLANPGWSPVETMVSHYVHARAGRLIPAALLSLAAASALLITLIPRTGRTVRAATGLLAAWTAALVTGAIFPADPHGNWDRPPTVSGMLHGTAAMIAFLALPVAAILLTRAWRRDPRRRPAARPLTVTAVLSTVTYLTLAVLFVDVTDGPSLTIGSWESLIGLAERLTLWSYVAWLAVAAAHLRKHTPQTVPAPARIG
jgi:hypothetical protein